MPKYLLLFAFIVLFCKIGFAQSQPAPNAFAFKVSEPIILDGVLDEEIWDSEGWNENFTQYFPSDTSQAKLKTRIKIAYDDENIYIAAVMYNLEPRKYVSTSLRRDYRGDANDGVTFMFDTFNDKTNAFQFGVNPYGVQREGLVSNGGSKSEDLSLAWDNKWFSEAVIYEDRWQVEAIIPLSTLRYKDGAQNWNVNFYRIDSHEGEKSTWSPIPRQFSVLSLAFNRKLIFEEPLEKNTANISLIPYVASRMSRNFLEGTKEKPTPAIGGDAKIGIGPALNLDLTFNPDFSQVEVDEQVTNLDRFEIFFPERRQFFLENGDLFANFGHPLARPFFSRRIGVDRDENTGQNIQNKIIYGARISGKITDDWRVGMMNMQTASDDEAGISGKNFSVLAVQKKVFARSNIGFIFVDRESLGLDEYQSVFDPNAYNRLIGLEYNLASEDNRWTGKAFYHRTFEKEVGENPGTFNAFVRYNDLHWNGSVSYLDIGESYNPLVGYAPRVDYKRINPDLAYVFFPKSRIINRHGPKIDYEQLFNENLGTTDRDLKFIYEVRFQNLAQITITQRNRYIYLFKEFDPTRTGGETLPAGTDYNTNTIGVELKSNPRKFFNITLMSEFGQYFTGNIRKIQSEMALRLGYIANISMNFSYNQIRLPEPQADANLLLVGPRIDLTVSKKLFWTTFIQYNNQIDNLNINTRLQWRYATVSDMFIVYTDNYFPGDFMPKQRSLVFKLNYWLNL
ncbi:carbohydrate binding family 9 domain-containing protein [Algoriphagus aquimarinus]|uniref:Carbohydrate binding family 9 domain-containing protein n=1 Tax=Algoriphagus aquimarinus TaxID=237018 RepID=A0A5C7B3M3_9BACT|nr:carbohydrate binding family 9 domain-containing protein [Algoriphagus aquimarinus]TXE14523.1 carbohydrate binding family 9 domain-containing protein [Algoriphagus aquimarinus]